MLTFLLSFVYRALTLFRQPSQTVLLEIQISFFACPITPNFFGLGSFHFARHYFGNRFLLSFPPGT